MEVEVKVEVEVEVEVEDRGGGRRCGGPRVSGGGLLLPNLVLVRLLSFFIGR